MNINIQHQESYSRLELLLREFLVWLIYIPHIYLLLFLGIWSCILTFISWWAILFTAKYPKSFFDFQVDLMRWYLRLTARLYNMSDGYPALGLKVEDARITLDIPYPETLSRGTLLLKTFFGWLYVLIPHVFLLFFRSIAAMVLMFIAFWAVLFTGKYPKSMFDFVLGTIRWNYRLSLYISFMSDEYPPFTGK